MVNKRKKRHQRRRASGACNQQESDKSKPAPEDLSTFSDETFAHIAGYTSGGAPFGVTRAEWREAGYEVPDK